MARGPSQSRNEAKQEPQTAKSWPAQLQPSQTGAVSAQRPLSVSTATFPTGSRAVRAASEASREEPAQSSALQRAA